MLIMELIERDGFLRSLETKFESVTEGEGHCILLSGEAGIGKTSLIKSFYKEKKDNCKIYQGTCDALFTPRPLAPIYDIIWQIQKEMSCIMWTGLYYSTNFLTVWNNKRNLSLLLLRIYIGRMKLHLTL